MGFCSAPSCHRISRQAPFLAISAFFLQHLYHKYKHEAEEHHSRGHWLKTALQRSLPFILLASFTLTPSVSKGIFATLACAKYQLDDPDSCKETGCNERSFLVEDPTIVCSDRGEIPDYYAYLRTLAWVFMVMWPIGMPLLNLAVLYPNKVALRQRRKTQGVKATQFLHKEYSPLYFWWEVLPLLQRLILTGFVLVIPVEHDTWRIFGATPVAEE